MVGSLNVADGCSVDPKLSPINDSQVSSSFSRSESFLMSGRTSRHFVALRHGRRPYERSIVKEVRVDIGLTHLVSMGGAHKNKVGVEAAGENYRQHDT